MKTLLFSLLATINLAASNNALSHENHNGIKSQYSQKKLTDSLSMLSKKGGNIILSSGDDGLLIIDNGYSELSSELEIALNNTGHGKKLRYIINTHWHFDHTGGNDALGANTTIIAHDNVRKRLSQPQQIPFFNKDIAAHPSHALPSLTYPQAMRIHFNNDELQLEHFANSHTDGDTVVFFKKANVVHMGDLMFYPFFPFIDLHNGGNAINYLKSIQQINSRIDDKTIVIPGHGSVTNKKGLTEFQQMLESTIATVSAAKKRGLSLEAIQQKGLPEQWQIWAKGFINEATWISFIYQSLSN